MTRFMTNAFTHTSMVCAQSAQAPFSCDQPVSDNVLQELAKLEPVYKVRFVGRVV